METDRGAVLTIRAAARGVIDFREADIHDVRWWSRANRLIRAVADEDEIFGLSQALRYQLALVGNGNINDDDFARAQERARTLLRELIDMLQPWTAGATKHKLADSLSDIREAYKSVFGDPSDPEVQAKLDRMLEAFNKAQAEKKEKSQESQEEELDRRIAERDRRYREERERARRR